MKILSLFDGISCGMVAMQRAGVLVSEYHACEVDKYAIQISQKNWPEIVRHGSVVDYHPDRHFDYLIGGSPCQGFSFAGKQLAFDDPRSKLFFEYVRILKECREINPNIKFLLENVKMKKEYLAVISEQLGGEPVCINSALVSAQNRVRYYWANFPITQPEDRGLVLRDIIESGAVDREKSYCIDANYHKGGNPKRYFEKSSRQLVGISETKNGIRPYKNDGRKGSFSEIGTINVEGGKASCVSSAHAPKIRLPQSARRAQIQEYSERCQKQIKKNSKSENEKAIAICGNANMTGSGVNVLTDGITYRKLTVIECERLQTLPDGYTDAVSNTQRYKCLGNGWTVDVLAHIFNENNS